MNNYIALPIVEFSQVGEARRFAVSLAKRLDFDETGCGKVSIIVTEVANNLVRHAKNGQLLLQFIEQNNTIGIQILALDKSPGIVNVSECLRDGYSTSGTFGNGLGAISRLASFFDIYSLPQVGTAVLAQLWPDFSDENQPQDSFDVGVVCLPKSGEEVSGDSWAKASIGERELIIVVDGLGHGILAARASQAAINIFREHTHRSPQEIVEFAHAGMRHTRGAALAVVEINLMTKVVRFAGVGNISAAIFYPQGCYRMVSHNGTVGHEVRKIVQFSYKWELGSTLIMHTDGLQTHWQLERYPGLTVKHPSIIAGVLYRDFSRERDDVTVLVARERERGIGNGEESY